MTDPNITTTAFVQMASALEDIALQLRKLAGSSGNDLADLHDGEAHVTTGDDNAPDEMLLTREGLAEMLNIGLRSLSRLRNERDFPAPLRIGSAARWRRSDIEAWMEHELASGKRPIHRRKSR